MHTTDRTTTPPHLLGAAAVAAVKGFVTLVGSLWRVRRNRREVADLLEFDDRMLADIGLMRGDVTSALASPLDVDPSTRLRIFAVERRAGMRAQAMERYDLLAGAERAVRGLPPA
ncbi:DUF1127 domain-containing protein [Prosthecomicrobium sp. N25]|uniref:DUF1127 domain-containing protein n=1 Tax=Prosthecomicrobium sp. N25 TaxID=3129254 RepID=UPI003076A82E